LGFEGDEYCLLFLTGSEDEAVLNRGMVVVEVRASRAARSPRVVNDIVVCGCQRGLLREVCAGLGSGLKIVEHSPSMRWLQ